MDMKRLIRDTEAAEILGCSRSTLWRRVKDGTIPQPLKIGGMTRWHIADIEAVIATAIQARAA